MRKDSCRQCTKRRIVCDRGTPKCAKCIKKGIDCSGIGRQYRFVQGLASQRKLEMLSQLKNPKSIDNAFDTSLRFHTFHMRSDQRTLPDEAEYAEAESSQSPSQSLLPCTTPRNLMWDDLPMPFPQSVEILNPGIMMLFDHFAKIIAPYMVVLDSKDNGYRHTILPLACHYPLVQRAVSVVSAFHLSSRRPELFRPASAGRSAIIAKLREDASNGENSEVFTISTWATLLVLLVGETITGSKDFVHLFGMLNALIKYNGLVSRSDSDSRFLMQQSQMFELFTTPLLGPHQSPDIFEDQPDTYFEFLSLPPFLESEHFGTIAIIKEAIKRVLNIFLIRTAGKASCNTACEMLEKLRLLVLPVTPDTPGAHTLVWVYFVAAAESLTTEHRSFFYQRLSAVYRIGEFGNIPVALRTLTCIWGLDPQQRWIEEIDLVAPVLII